MYEETMTNQERPRNASSWFEEQRVGIIALTVAFITTLLFFGPFFSHGGRPAAFAFEGDALHVTIAQFGLSSFFAQHGIFSGIDFFTENGASEYFLRLNIPAYEPFVLLFSFFLSGTNAVAAGLMYVLLCTVHAFLCVLFLQKLCTRFLNMDVALAAFIAVGYAFSGIVAQSLWCVPFAFIAWLFPVCIYAGLRFKNFASPLSALFTSMPFFCMYLGGYVPLALVSTALTALCVIGIDLLATRGWSSRARFRSALQGLTPLFIASALVAPFYLSATLYYRTVEIAHAGADTLKGVAHDLAELPQNLPRLMADTLNYPGPKYEFSLFWGLVPLLIFIVYFAQYKPVAWTGPARTGRSPNRRWLLLVSLVVYFTFVLAIFGPSSAMSNIFYFFVPIAGYMHLYQRYLVLAHLFFILFIALMLDDVASDRRKKAAKLMAALFGFLTIAAAHLVGHQPWDTPTVTAGFVIEALLAFLFLIGLILLDRRGVIVAATALIFLVSLGTIYRPMNDTTRWYEEKVQNHSVLGREDIEGIGAYFRANSQKAIIKYIDLLPGPQPLIPKNLPWLLLRETKLSSYYGYDWHVGTNYLYRGIMGIALPAGQTELIFRPDWEWLRATGAEFVLFREGLSGNDPKLADYVDLRNPARAYRFTGDHPYVIAPLKFPPLSGDPIVFDNGYVRVRSADPAAKVSDFWTNDAGSLSFTVESSQPAKAEYLFWPNSHHVVRVDDSTVPTVIEERLLTASVPGGKHQVSISYEHALLTLFVIFYALYVGLILVGGGFLGFRLIQKQYWDSPDRQEAR